MVPVDAEFDSEYNSSQLGGNSRKRANRDAEYLRNGSSEVVFGVKVAVFARWPQLKMVLVDAEFDSEYNTS